MLTKSILAAGALLSVVAAVPMQQNKRDVVWETKLEEEYVTVDVTTTIWLNPGETPPVVAPAGKGENPGHYGHGGHHHGHKPKVTSHIKSTVTVPAPSQPTESAAPPAETPSSPYVAPTPTSTYVAPPPTTTSAAPVTTSAAPPAYSSPAAAPSSAPSGGKGAAPSGETFTGDLTYYTPGMGSCGVTNTDSDAIVALAENMMAAKTPASGNPNENPLCGKSITISYGGKTATAKIMDTCPGCANGGLDLTPSLFQDFAPLGEGRLTGMKWWYN